MSRIKEPTFHRGRNIERNFRNGYVADRGPCYDVCGTFEFELEALGISDSGKERSKSHGVQRMKWLLREGNFEICDVTSGYIAYSVGLWQLELWQDTHVSTKTMQVKKTNLSSVLATCLDDYIL